MGAIRTVKTAYALKQTAEQLDPGFERLRAGEIDWLSQVPVEFGKQRLEATFAIGTMAEDQAKKHLLKLATKQLTRYAQRTQFAALGAAILTVLDLTSLVMGRRWIWMLGWMAIVGIPMLAGLLLQWQRWRAQVAALQSLHHTLTGEGSPNPRFETAIEFVRSQEGAVPEHEVHD